MDKQIQQLLVNGNGYMFSVTQPIAVDLDAIKAKGVTVANDVAEMLSTAERITGEEASLLNGTEYVITENDGVLMITDGRGVTVALEVDEDGSNVPVKIENLADYIAHYTM